MMHQDILIPSKASFDKGTLTKILLAAHMNQIVRLDGVSKLETDWSVNFQTYRKFSNWGKNLQDICTAFVQRLNGSICDCYRNVIPFAAK